MTLIDPTIPRTQDPLLRVLSGGQPTTRLAEGLYAVGHYNFGVEINTHRVGEWEPYPEELPGHLGAPCGVCDSVEQFMALFGAALESDPRGFCVAFTLVKKSEQPGEGGWRWHKWGPYVGTGAPKYEYLYDEPDFEEVFCFHVYEHKTWRMGGAYD